LRRSPALRPAPQKTGLSLQFLSRRRFGCGFRYFRSIPCAAKERPLCHSLNGFIETQKQLPGDVALTTILFNHEHQLLHNGKDMKKPDG
jgi:hypothetical protein